MSLQQLQDSLATLYRPKIGRDSSGGLTQEPNTQVYTGVPCSCQQAGASTVMLYAQRNIEVAVTLYFLQDPKCHANDRFVVTNLRTGAVLKMNVQGVVQPLARGRVWTVHCQLIDAPV